MEWTLNPFVVSTPDAPGVGIKCRDWIGLKAARSKIEPRSTKKASSRCPAKNVPAPFKSCIAEFARSVYLGVDRGPMFTGGLARFFASTALSPDLRLPKTLVTE